jgi:hypothetical protein
LYWRNGIVAGVDRDQLKEFAIAFPQLDFRHVSAWCLSGFQGCNGAGDYANLCIRHEVSQVKRMLASAIRDLELAGAPLESWKNLEAAAKEFKLENRGISQVLKTHATEAPAECDGPTEAISPVRQHSHRKRASSKKLLQRANLLTPEGLSSVLKLIREANPWLGSPEIWRDVIERVPAGQESEFLNTLTTADEIEISSNGILRDKDKSYRLG